MKLDDREVYDRHWWAAQMPTYPKSQFAGGPLALVRHTAGRILVEIACGVQPKASFALEGISARTYDRYLKRSKVISSGAENALPEKSMQSEIDRYLFAYFELQSMALEIAGIQRSKAEAQMMVGAPTRRITRKRVFKSRQVLCGSQVITLRDETNIEACNTIEHQPRLPRVFVQNTDA
ncbi:MAG TPA: hypothetical protein VGL56_13550 [Fimbriimonadaceae bacterium]|jgi:hypothetical protein